MSAKIIDGVVIANKLLAESKTRVAQSSITPGLAVVRVGDDSASKVYVGKKIKACEQTGVISYPHVLSKDTSQSEVLALIESLNNDDAVHGILVQLPLPAGIDANRVLESITPQKDVDGFHAHHMGRLVADLPSLRPCTPVGCLILLKHSGVVIEGAQAVVIGRSHIVGKPMALLLINAGATVTVCNSKTKNLRDICRQADIVVAAIGRAKQITADMIKPGAVVIDVGINRLDNGKLVGDVDFDGALAVAGAITPVPGGVGPMTVAVLVTNTLRAAGI